MSLRCVLPLSTKHLELPFEPYITAKISNATFKLPNTTSVLNWNEICGNLNLVALFLFIHSQHDQQHKLVFVKEHSYYLGDHKTLPVEDTPTPERYSIEKCTTHRKHDIDESCKLCKKLFCDRCKARERCPATKRKSKIGRCFLKVLTLYALLKNTCIFITSNLVLAAPSMYYYFMLTMIML